MTTKPADAEFRGDRKLANEETSISMELQLQLSTVPAILRSLPDGVKLVAAGPENVDVIAQIVNARRASIQDDRKMTSKELLRAFSSPSRVDHEFVLAIDESSGKCVGYLSVDLREPIGDGNVYVWAVPQYPNHQKLEDSLLAVGEILIRGKESRVPAHVPFTIESVAMAYDTALIDLLLKHGYRFNRSWYTMSKELLNDQELEKAHFPAGLEIRPYIREAHVKLLHAAQQEAFRDHSGRREDTPFDRWLHYTHHSDRFDPELFFVAWEGTEICGGIWAVDSSSKLPGVATIAIVFSRKRWRRQGIATNMLRHSFGVLKTKGFTSCELIVDAKSKTNALSVYTRAGMTKKREDQTYIKLLRGDPEKVID